MDKIDKITVVGGGDGGLLAALCIEKLNPEIDIRVIDNFEEEIPQVGKSTYFEIVNILHNFLEIDEQRFISEVKPVWKASVYFKDWCGYTPFHFSFDIDSILPNIDDKRVFDSCYCFYDELSTDEGFRTLGGELVEREKSPLIYTNDGLYKYPNVAYHLSTNRFNGFLRTLCRERGISLVDDEITDVEARGDRIETVRSDGETYTADLYVDASGFSRIVKKEVSDEFNSFDCPLDSALVTTAETSLSDVVPATVVETGDYGWFWQIDTVDNRDLGYVYASDFVSDGEALSEFVNRRDEPIRKEAVEKYEFDSGFYENAWTGNCITNGNAQGFVEPLQSTGLTCNADAARALSRLLASHGRVNDDGVREVYNSYVQGLWNSIYDFISVHYKYSTGDNEFWDAARSIEISDKVETYIDLYDRAGLKITAGKPIKPSGTTRNMLVFNRQNLYFIMRYMGAESSFYEDNDFTIDDEYRAVVERALASQRDRADQHLTHEEVYKSQILGMMESGEIELNHK